MTLQLSKTLKRSQRRRHQQGQWLTVCLFMVLSIGLSVYSTVPYQSYFRAAETTSTVDSKLETKTKIQDEKTESIDDLSKASTSTSTTSNSSSIPTLSMEQNSTRPSLVEHKHETTTRSTNTSTNITGGIAYFPEINKSTKITNDIIAATIKYKDDIVIEMKYVRPDRLGSNIQRPLNLMAYANCNDFKFCIKEGSFGPAKYFDSSIEACPPYTPDLKLYERLDSTLLNTPPTKPGQYTFLRDDDALIDWTKKNIDCGFDDVMRRKWGDMIINASLSPHISNSTLAEEELFESTDDPNVVTVAVHIRRGDFIDWNRKPFLDQFYVALLRRLRSILQKAGKSPEVHVFSEDYGLVHRELNITRNWTMYDGLVEHFHLAQDMRGGGKDHAMNMDLNLRDWRHFVKADILVVGGTFSRVPALGRPEHPNPKTGLPLTIDHKETTTDMAMYKMHWKQICPIGLELTNLPKVFAKHNTVPAGGFFKDLKADFIDAYNLTGNDF
ncbi:hypothetical protein FRACYDRAFT_250207 [Fragilariopsis cylindrus CCMP1102]|uniref:Uncharacterized protein n=1 Tax=Fragilariopsis cylindrus CCMP1102 TaxID=635003 RepID=A0A1E7EQA7_9STRA|nr:hypothetical protein FRACYDRAFT_250207 [Fragilariopsis cylindrus CCMP1102]|eukprot:OEU07987.1 hypothetical protein FRACYDRAFT_250207 [Fragilariopsis cylindrus CCMP1102]